VEKGETGKKVGSPLLNLRGRIVSKKIELSYGLYWRIYIGDKEILDFENHEDAEAFVKELYPSSEYIIVPLVVCKIRK